MLAVTCGDQFVARSQYPFHTRDTELGVLAFRHSARILGSVESVCHSQDLVIGGK